MRKVGLTDGGVVLSAEERADLLLSVLRSWQPTELRRLRPGGPASLTRSQECCHCLGPSDHRLYLLLLLPKEDLAQVTAQQGQGFYISMVLSGPPLQALKQDSPSLVPQASTLIN